MDIPSATDPRWLSIVMGNRSIQFDFLAAKILLGRMQMLTEDQKNPATYQAFAVQLHDLLESNRHLPSVQRDLLKISG